MMDVGRHPKIELLTYSEIENVTGYIGNFHVNVRKKARYVDEEACTACEKCAEVCPVVTYDEHQLGLASRKAIYIPFPQAVPASYLINMEDCLGTNPIACGKCLEACDPKCIDYDDQDRIIELDVGVIIVATGMDVIDPTLLDEYHYTKYQNVLTSWEFEILTGPGYVTGSELLRPTDRKVPKSIGFIQCVGSRDDKRGHPYCSNICCMNTVKDTLYLKEHYPDMECNVYYMDIRTFGKQYEDLYKRSKEMGVRYIRGIPGDVEEDPETKNVIVAVENTTTGKLEHHELEMLVLSVGVEPRVETADIQKILTLSKAPDGFLAESHYQLNPIDSPTGGIFLAGCCESPKDVKGSVTQASGAAARAERLLSQRRVKVEAITSKIDPELCTSCGLCVKVCPYGAIEQIGEPGKGSINILEAVCMGCGNCAAECNFDAIEMPYFTKDQILAQIDAALEERPQEKCIVFACNWCSYAGADLAGIEKRQYPTCGLIIRTMCSARFDESFVERAFEKGAGAVLITGCRLTDTGSDCHYNYANRLTWKRFKHWQRKYARKGIDGSRLQLQWISAAEGKEFAEKMAEMDAVVQEHAKSNPEKVTDAG